ncbi:related to kinesin-related protein KLPA [Cephalotrichum gorgonifer]|uniref:Related to kinesin-related protein KLPA n=1 Tax=Cephalotrichum gorgonifer TaxID=2041049 RepID=A0AAE8N3N6_9PEZI|nr:related to kinesin-related protein KLPA [Cephalotrichum gorgonifer]
MDQFLLENTSRFLALVDAFKPTATGGKQDAIGNPDITIATRLRPMLPDETSSGIVPGVFPRANSKCIVDLHELRKTIRGTPALNSTSFGVDRVFTADDTSEVIFNELVQPLVHWAWSGGVSTMFAYGQTGSGKTFTVGALETLVAKTLMAGELEGSRRIYLSIIELTGNSAFDLLNSRKPVSILEDSFGSTHLAGSSEHLVEDGISILTHIENAARFRSTAFTQKNDASSRSHAICRIRLENAALPELEDGLLYLIDLAGSEAARDVSAHSADRMKEAREINASLAVLKDCIRGRATLDPVSGSEKTPSKSHIPFRQASLTRILKHVFDPATVRGCRTVVVACINPSLADVGASKNTLRYAEMLRVPTPKARPPRYDASRPATWSNEQFREWAEKSSGTPPVSAEILAPYETGAQMLRLPVPEFLTRCLKVSGVTEDQARAFQAKFWRLHVDSTRAARAQKATEASVTRERQGAYGLSSVDPRPEVADLPFKQRIRPGMVVAWASPDDESRQLAVVLAPEERIPDESQNATRYRCARVSPGVMAGSYEVYLWHQTAVEVEAMYAEVFLEYDMATRYYYETV